MNDQIFQEHEDYSETPPFIISLVSPPDGMVLSQAAREVTWHKVYTGRKLYDSCGS